MSSKDVTCKEVMQHICECLAEELESDKCGDIRAHLDECSKCRDYFQSVEITIDCYRKYNVDLPKDAHNRLMKFLDLDDSKK